MKTENSVALMNTLLLLTYLALMSANDLKYFQGAQSCNKESQNQYQRWNDNPLAHPKPQCSTSYGNDTQANSSYNHAWNSNNRAVSQV